MIIDYKYKWTQSLWCHPQLFEEKKSERSSECGGSGCCHHGSSDSILDVGGAKWSRVAQTSLWRVMRLVVAILYLRLEHLIPLYVSFIVLSFQLLENCHGLKWNHYRETTLWTVTLGVQKFRSVEVNDLADIEITWMKSKSVEALC